MSFLGTIFVLIILALIGAALYGIYIGILYIGWQWSVLILFLLGSLITLFMAYKAQSENV